MIILPFTRADLNLPQQDSPMPKRSSVSGVQDKIELSRKRGKFEVVESGGEFLLKPIPSTPLPKFQKDVPANEALTMRIASKIFGIKTAENQLVQLKDGEFAYLTKRFDYRNGVKIRQEDFCQLAGRSAKTHGSSYKYDASYEECAQIVRRFCPAAKIELVKLFKLVLFCYVFSNGDAHLKNFSLYESIQGDAVLTPAYDLLSTSLHVPGETPLALDLFADGHLTPSFEKLGFYSSADFIELGACFGIDNGETLSLISEFAAAEKQVSGEIKNSMLSQKAKKDYLARYCDRRRAILQ